MRGRILALSDEVPPGFGMISSVVVCFESLSVVFNYSRSRYPETGLMPSLRFSLVPATSPLPWYISLLLCHDELEQLSFFFFQNTVVRCSTEEFVQVLFDSFHAIWYGHPRRCDDSPPVGDFSLKITPWLLFRVFIFAERRRRLWMGCQDQPFVSRDGKYYLWSCPVVFSGSVALSPSVSLCFCF